MWSRGLVPSAAAERQSQVVKTAPETHRIRQDTALRHPPHGSTPTWAIPYAYSTPGAFRAPSRVLLLLPKQPVQRRRRQIPAGTQKSLPRLAPHPPRTPRHPGMASQQPRGDPQPRSRPQGPHSMPDLAPPRERHGAGTKCPLTLGLLCRAPSHPSRGPTRGSHGHHRAPSRATARTTGLRVRVEPRGVGGKRDLTVDSGPAGPNVSVVHRCLSLTHGPDSSQLDESNTVRLWRVRHICATLGRVDVAHPNSLPRPFQENRTLSISRFGSVDMLMYP